MSKPFGTITLFGSGELAESMARVHHNVLARAGDSPKPVFLDTPAGFELNSDEIGDRAVDYFRTRLGCDLEIASFKSRNADDLQIERALYRIQSANYVFAGPGSPTFAVCHWRGTPVWDAVVERWQHGAHLVFASAAAISLGAMALPVYEIFKAGQDVGWMDGLNLLDRLGLKLAVMPHWNNAEGGTFDTRFCFMGKPRLKILEQQLEPGIAILGLDEYTAITIDPDAGTCRIAGAGRVTWRYNGDERCFPSGATVPLDKLRPHGLQDLKPTTMPKTAPSSGIQMTAQYLEQLARALRSCGFEPEAQRELVEHAHAKVHELAGGWRGTDSLMPDRWHDALVDF